MNGNNRAVSYQELSYMDCTPLLAQFIYDLLSKGGTFKHESTTVRRNLANQEFTDPVTKKVSTLPENAVYIHDGKDKTQGGAGNWRILGRNENLGNIASYLADRTPKDVRYSLMVDVLNALNAPVEAISYAPKPTLGY